MLIRVVQKSFFIYLSFWLAFLPGQAQAQTQTDRQPLHMLQNEVMGYIQQLKEGIDHTHYAQVVNALHQLNETSDSSFKQLIDPLAPLYELIQALNTPGREYFLVPELKLYLSHVAYRYAQQTFRIVYETRQPVDKESKETMHKQLTTSLRLLDPTREPITPVIFNLRYILAVVDNLPDTTVLLDEGTPFLINLLNFIQSVDIEAGVDMVSFLMEKSQAIDRGKQVEQITLVEALEKGVWIGDGTSLLDQLQELYQKTSFEEVRYAIIQVWGRISRAYYGSSHIATDDSQSSKIAFTAFSQLLSAAIPQNTEATVPSDYIQAAVAFELILLENLLDPIHSQVVERYLQELGVQSSKKKSWWNRFKAKMSIATSPTAVECILNNRSTVFRMSHLGQLIDTQKPIDSIQSYLERIEQQQKAILEVLKHQAL